MTILHQLLITLCIQVPALRNLEYILCYYGGAHFKTDNGEACLKNELFGQVSNMIAVLPYWWRIMQVHDLNSEFP
jgi:hypothetical protein